MASVHRQAGSPHYFAFYRLPEGIGPEGRKRWKLIKRSTGKEKYADAMTVAQEMEKQAVAKAGAGDDRSRAYMRVLEDAHKDAIRGLLNLRTASDYLSQITEIAIGKPLVSYTIETWFRFWLESKTAAKRSGGTLLRYTGVVDSFLESLSVERRAAPLGSLGMEEIVAFQQLNQSAGKSAATVNLAVKTLSMALKRATELGHIKINPAKGFDKMDATGISKEVFTLPQLKKLLDFAAGDWKGAILFGYFTGMRLSDIVALQWEKFDKQREWLRFTDKKTNKDIQVPLHPQIQAYLEKHCGLRKGPLFPQLHGKSTSGASGLSMAFAAIMKKAGIEGEKVKAAGSGGRTRSSLSFHSLRHSFTSALANAGVSPEIRQKLTGHLDSKTHQIYTHQDKTTLRKSVELVPGL